MPTIKIGLTTGFVLRLSIGWGDENNLVIIA